MTYWNGHLSSAEVMLGAAALTRPVMRRGTTRRRARLASPDEGVRAYVSPFGSKKINGSQPLPKVKSPA
jgi:hypothetical protein